MKKILLFVLLITTVFVNAQVINPEQRAREELSKRGLNDEEVRQRLSAKGIDLSNLDPNDAAGMFKAQKALEEVLKEIEAESLETSSFNNKTALDTLKEADKKVIAKESDKISKSVKEGASVEEAVSETLIENQKIDLPPASMYGQELFRNNILSLFRQSKDVKAPENYLLGVGDILAVTIWGDSEDSNIYTINEDGYIKPSGIPRIYLKGIKYGEAKKLLAKRFSNYYKFRENQFEVSLNYARTINVTIVGEVYNPGSFNIPAINTAFNALVAAGGPSNIGSVRNIKLIRKGQEVKIIDVYKYLQNPAIGDEFYLEENDIIFVPNFEKVITVQGAIQKPFKYELLSNENYGAIIELAGGYKPNAYLKNVQIIRFIDNKEVIIDIDASLPQNKNFDLLNGDFIFISDIKGEAENFIVINGAVKNPGTYALAEGQKLKDVIEKVQLENPALLELSYIKRLNEDGKTISYLPINIKEALDNPLSEANIVIQNKDIISIFSRYNQVDASFFAVEGAVRTPDSFAYDYKKTIRVSDAILFANGVTRTASNIAYIKRKDSINVTLVNYIKVDLDEILSNPESEENIYLEANDVLVVFDKRELSDELYVTIGGEVRNPGRIIYDPSLSIQDIILLSKGLSFEASPKKIDIYRLDIDKDRNSKIIAASIQIDENYNIVGENFELQPFDEIYVRKAPEFERPRKVRIRGEVKFPGEYVLIDENERFSDIVRRAGGFTNEASLKGSRLYREFNGTGYVIADFEKAIRKPKSQDDLILMQQDDITVPKIERIVTIYGNTRAAEHFNTGTMEEKINAPFEKGKRANYYLDKYAGGLSDNADRSNITVKNITGKVNGTKKFLFWRIYPKVEEGAIVYVPEKPLETTNKEKKEIDWGDILQNSVAQATSILTLLLLLRNVQ